METQLQMKCWRFKNCCKTPLRAWQEHTGTWRFSKHQMRVEKALLVKSCHCTSMRRGREPLPGAHKANSELHQVGCVFFNDFFQLPCRAALWLMSSLDVPAGSKRCTPSVLHTEGRAQLKNEGFVFDSSWSFSQYLCFIREKMERDKHIT